MMNLQKRRKKGQYFSFDAIIASTIFIITFISLLSYWFSVKSSLESRDEDISREAARISDLMFTPSYLLDSYSVKKVEESRLQAIPCTSDALKKEFNSPYNMYLSVSSETGSSILRCGDEPPADARNVAKVRRIFVLYDQASDSQAAMDIYLYT